MEDRTIIKRFSDTINIIAERFPHQHQWQQLKNKFEAEFGKQKDQAETASDKLPANDNCPCCNIRKRCGENLLCDECLKLYRPVNSSIIENICDCGHRPAGPEIFLFYPYGRSHSLCSIDCVKDHYRQLFGPLLRRLK